MSIEISSHTPGEVLASLQIEPITRHALALYCGASGDHNPLHVDIDAARRSGMDDVIAHGMLVMAYLGRLVMKISAPENIRDFSVRFQAVVHVHDALSCVATLHSLDHSARTAQVSLTAICQRQELKASGKATINF
jgi:acyl dehydratase